MSDWTTIDWVLFVVVTLPFVVVWIGTIVEVVRRPDLRGLRAVVWIAALALLPIVSVAVYVVVRTPRPRTFESSGGSPSRAERFVELAEQRQSGTIDTPTYAAEVADLLDLSPRPA